MDLPSILESLLVASESPLPSPELARLVRARAAEFSEDSITENPENAPAPDSPERVLDLEALAETSENEIKDALVELNKIYETSGRSFVVAERSKGWKIYTRADYAGFVKLLFPGRKPERLSPPAMETLAIIAYRQPVTKSALEAVRGVSCDGMLQKLLDRELIKISGRADLPRGARPVPGRRSRREPGCVDRRRRSAKGGYRLNAHNWCRIFCVRDARLYRVGSE